MDEAEAINEIFVTQDGSHSITAAQYGVSYHSKYGAITESRHVFIQAGLMPLLFNVPDQLAILEIGFGTGLNVLLTYQELGKRPIQVYYETVERFPITQLEAQDLNYPELVDGENLRAMFTYMHNCDWDEHIQLSGNFSLKKRLGDLEALPFEPIFDLIYFDAFAPTTQPELWTEAIMKKMYGALRPGGILVTYCAKGEFKRSLKAVGFVVEPLPGPPGKREMTKAIKERA
jgi:tRNA U34 5-methylaminomethyl-2-thiouridine-forming methyltransferase MnmC